MSVPKLPFLFHAPNVCVSSDMLMGIHEPDVQKNCGGNVVVRSVHVAK